MAEPTTVSDMLAEPPLAPATRAGRLGRGLRLALLAAAALAMFHVFSSVDLGRARVLLARVGWPLALVPLPAALALSIDALGLGRILRLVGHRAAATELVGLRMSAEAVALAIPGGSVAAEAVKLSLLTRRTGAPPPVAAGALAIAKATVVRAESVYLAGAAALVVLGVVRGGRPQSLRLALAAGGAAGVTALASAVALALLRNAHVVTRLGRWLTALPSARLRRAIESHRQALEATDQTTARFFAAPLHARALCLLPYVGEWLVEGLETLLILRCLSVPIGLGEALAFDGAGSFLRALAFFVPAGLGVQDAGQLFLLGVLGVPDPTVTGGAFIFIKRTKEVFWIALGASLLAARKKSWARKRTR